MSKEIINPIHRGQDSIYLARVNSKTYEASRGYNDPATMQTFIVSVGWEDTYISPATRSHYSTYEDRKSEFKLDNKREARTYGDEIIREILVKAHSRADVVKLFDINNTNALCGKNCDNRKKYFAAKRQYKNKGAGTLFGGDREETYNMSLVIS